MARRSHGHVWVAATAILLGTLSAQAAPPDPARKTIACMASADVAGTFAGGCIGLIYADCMKPPNADSGRCGARELAFWQGQLDTTLKQSTAAVAGYPDMMKPQSDAQKSWLAFRGKACAIADHVDPGTMP
ncbi:MAG TPA: hypothetical protein VJ476_08245, partial [Rhizomicrobium sp.]|nr:hypothetical protein [Rhizomicrobium sp.]